MVWFILSIVLYIFVTALLMFFIHRESEKRYQDRTEINEEKLQELNKAAQFARIHALVGQTGNKEYNAGRAVVDNVLNKKPKPQKTRVLPMMLFMFAMIAIPIILLIIVRKAFLPEGFIAIDADILITGYIAAGAFGMCCLMWLPFASAKLNEKIEKRFGQESMREFAKTSTSTFISKILVLFSFIIIFPFMALAMNTYAGYNDSGIIYNSFFSIEPTTTQYTEITNVNRYFHRSNNGTISSMHYAITLNDGKVLDVLFGGDGYVDQTYEIHKKIIDVRPDLFQESVQEPSEEIKNFLRNHTNEEKNKIYYFFGMSLQGSL